jgi:dipeptidyl aminopeptidase/acylaminoacyl peptidase
MTKIYLLSLIMLILLVPTLKAQINPHPFSVHDLVVMDRISDPAVSPDGKQVVFVLYRTDLEANRGRKDLWLVNADGTNLQQLTTHPENDSDPCWAADGKSIWFLSKRSGSVQVWRIFLESRLEKQITNLPLDVGYLLASPDGRYIVLSVEVYPGMTISQTKARLDEIANRKASGVIYNNLLIRHWDSWKDGRRLHLFILPVDGETPRDLMFGMDADTPSKPFGDMKEVTFTPDGLGIIFTARDAGPEEAWSTNLDLFYAPLDGSQPPRCITPDNKAEDKTPLFSPDGKTLAYLAMERPQYESDRRRIVLRAWPEGKDRVLTEDFDRSVSEFFWLKDSKKIYALAENLGQNSLYTIDIRSGKADRFIIHGNVRAPQLAGKELIFGMDYLKSPVELYRTDLKAKKITAITQINAEKLKQVKLGNYEQFNFSGWNKETVYGYIVKPADFDSSKKYPVAFLIHGGPHGSFGNDFHYRWNPQTYAGAGYGVVMIDFHGSSGYGQEFQDVLRDDWGGKPLIDLQKGLEAALLKYPWLDGERVGALGASYGGYMINWIAGNWPDRFRCLVNHDGNLDERMAYFDTEELWFPEWEHLGTPWENPESYEKHNPVNYVKNWKTPMLVIHGEKDYRVVVTQGISTFNALQRKGIPSKFLYFPDENHWVLKPHNSILWHETVLTWLDQWLKEK